MDGKGWALELLWEPQRATYTVASDSRVSYTSHILRHDTGTLFRRTCYLEAHGQFEAG